MSNRPRLSIIYANHDTTDLLLRSIASVRDHAGGLALEIIVADDHSRDSPEAALQASPGVRFVRTSHNRGFGSTNNLGARLATGDHLLLLNTDAFLVAETRLAAILDYLDAHPGVGALLPQLVDERGRVQQTQIAHDPSAWRVIADKPVQLLMKIPILKSLLRPLAIHVNLDFAPLSDGRTVPVAVAAALFVRRDVFEAVAGFDEEFFMFYEDSDLCRRIRRAGKTIEYHPEWRIVHLLGSSVASGLQRKRLYFQSQRHYFRKHGAPLERLLIAILQPVYFAALETRQAMKIVIDARLDQTGIGRYVFALIRELAGIDRETDYVILLRRGTFEAFVPPGPNFRKCLADIPHYSMAEQTRLPMILRRERADLVHFPHFNVPILAGLPYVVTIHDLTLSTHSTRRDSAPGGIRHLLKRAGYHTVIRLAVARARHIVTLSAASRQAVVNHLGIDPATVTVTLAGADLAQFGAADPGALARFGVVRPYFLYVGAAYPHKNLARLIEAFARFDQRSTGTHQLVLAGDHGGFAKALRALAGRIATPNAVVFPGRVTDGELAALYANALAFTFVSLSEGFGLPGLEAMAHGVPVLASRLDTLTEVYGDAALFVDPADTSLIAAVLERLTRDAEVRAEMIVRGRSQVAKFSWRRMAEQTLQVYRNAIGPA